MPRAVRKGGVITELILSPKKGGAAIGFPVSPKSEISRVSRADMSKQMGVGIVGMPITETYVGKGSFLNWIENLKIAQRPYWAGEEVISCFICEAEFGFWERQHHCRKCGTAVCGKCSKYFVQLPEFAYY